MPKNDDLEPGWGFLNLFLKPVQVGVAVWVAVKQWLHNHLPKR